MLDYSINAYRTVQIIFRVRLQSGLKMDMMCERVLGNEIMTVNLTFIILFILSLMTMWIGVIFSLIWNKTLSRKRVLTSFLICAALSLLMAGIFTLIIADMGLLLEIDV